MEPKHQHLRRLSLPEHLGAAEDTDTPQERGAAGERGRHGDAGVDLRRRLHDRHRHPRRLRRRFHGGGQQRDHRYDAVSRGRLRLSLSQSALHQQRGGARKYGPLGPGSGAQVAARQRARLRWRSQPDHDIRRVRGRQFGVPAPDLAGHAGPRAPRHPAERHPQRPVELHDRREGERGGACAGGRLRMQLDDAAGEPGARHGMHEIGGRENTLRAAVEQLLGHPRLPVGAHHRRRFPAQGPAGLGQRGGFRRDRDPDWK